MQPDSRQTIHMGISFVVSPSPSIDGKRNLKFQQSLLEQGIEFSKVQFNEKEIVVVNEARNLNIRVDTIQPPQVGRLIAVAPQAGGSLGIFGKEAEAIVKAFELTWSAKSRQIISTDAAFRDLFETSQEHALKEIWEVRLGQPAEVLRKLGKPVLGGGLRFVMPPTPDDSEPRQIELKIEAFVKDSKKIWVETKFVWPQPLPPGAPFDPIRRLEEVNNYIESKVVPFITGES